MAEVVLNEVNKVYPNGYQAIKDLSLDIADGEFLVLVGPSGCGKSTALRMVAGLEDVSGGDLRIGDRVVNDVHPKDRDIAMVFQNYALYPHMTVADNIGFALKLAKVPKAEIADRVKNAARTLDLTEQLDRKPGQLSGGQRQRVAMGRAIVRQPKAFLMDEPLSNLDAKLRVQMRAEIAALQRDLGVTTIYVTHDQVEAMTMGDRVAVLKRGILQQVATPQELYDTPRNVFVAGFIGSPSMNLMKVRLVGSGSDLRLQLGSRELAFGQAVIDARPALADYVDGEVVVGIRPEDIEDASLESDAPEGQILHTETTLVESLGAEVILHFLLDAEPYAIMDAEFEGEDAVVATPDDEGRFTYVARVSPRSAAKIGDPIDLVVDTGRLHFFDPGTGLAITG
ncbi:MAG: sn-glycerol-3-phosphate ABC transporter ATP-binding protein UgpC [Actinomycetia bacterium]|nr:sn-glycerol-3-phosphate ABC transporter ATP-binding protein UgpC [Actinomycetes bacterium]MCP5034321.1 sn-glycerol-3-phosphate ABC transporter ATP-binding protein UgpC [Actinomycetes bacterium]